MLHAQHGVTIIPLVESPVSRFKKRKKWLWIIWLVAQTNNILPLLWGLLQERIDRHRRKGCANHERNTQLPQCNIVHQEYPRDVLMDFRHQSLSSTRDMHWKGKQDFRRYRVYQICLMGRSLILLNITKDYCANSICCQPFVKQTGGSSLVLFSGRDPIMAHCKLHWLSCASGCRIQTWWQPGSG